MDITTRGQLEIYYREFLRLVQATQAQIVWGISGPYDPAAKFDENNSLSLVITYDPPSGEYTVEILVSCQPYDHYSLGSSLSLSDILTIYTPDQRPIDSMTLSSYTPQGAVTHLSYKR
jgi:hypothetical protein